MIVSRFDAIDEKMEAARKRWKARDAALEELRKQVLGGA